MAAGGYRVPTIVKGTFAYWARTLSVRKAR